MGLWIRTITLYGIHFIPATTLTPIYGANSAVGQLDSSFESKYHITGSMLPISTYQALNGISPSLGLIAGVSRGNNGNIWVADIDNDRVIELNKAGGLVRGFYGSFLTELGAETEDETDTDDEETETYDVLHVVYNNDTGILYTVFDKSITMEFYINDDKELYVEYNAKSYKFSDFWQNVNISHEVCNVIYTEFKKQYPDKFRFANLGSKNWEETFLKVINNHLREYNKIIDVFIRRNGEVTFKLEHE